MSKTIDYEFNFNSGSILELTDLMNRYSQELRSKYGNDKNFVLINLKCSEVIMADSNEDIDEIIEQADY